MGAFIPLQDGRQCPQCVSVCKVELEKSTWTIWEKCKNCGRAWNFTRTLSHKAFEKMERLQDSHA